MLNIGPRVNKAMIQSGCVAGYNVREGRVSRLVKGMLKDYAVAVRWREDKRTRGRGD